MVDGLCKMTQWRTFFHTFICSKHSGFSLVLLRCCASQGSLLKWKFSSFYMVSGHSELERWLKHWGAGDPKWEALFYLLLVCKCVSSSYIASSFGSWICSFSIAGSS
ncbi:hypothetical protein KC19_2G235100 [Ceratodon purpureus]|uniref:Uncharacterized protein n=1 Tax=Ceratodon purpureus TaxID=3225 RepID=A0A8T0IX76_CERPU|nr:hypothetical protein KC19_2G235100 [Ceratodon purpureus]